MEQAHGHGPIGNHAASGLFAHNLLALTLSGQVLGLAAQLCRARAAGVTHKHTETRTQRYTRANKESEVWPKVLEAVGQVPPGCRWISIVDRGSDSFDYWSRAVSLGWQCLSTILTNRRTVHNGHLLTQARALPVRESDGTRSKSSCAMSAVPAWPRVAKVGVAPARPPAKGLASSKPALHMPTSPSLSLRGSLWRRLLGKI
jgi:hypothetical protein